MKSETGTTIRRRTAREAARIRTGIILAGAASLIFLGLRRVISSEPDFDGKVVLITGGSRGLGLALAEQFRRRGAHVALLARDLDELAAAKLQLARKHHIRREILLLPANVADEVEVRDAVQECIQHFGGRLDVLVNNAGVIQVGPITSQTTEDFRRAMDVNFWGVLNTTLAALPHMMERQAGRIVNITSIGAKISMPHLLPYNASKFAALGFSLGLRAELADKGIAVTTVVPGLLRTGSYMNATFKGNTSDEYSWFSLSSSLPGLSMPAERAARQIVDASWNNKAEVVLGIPAKIGSLLNALSPDIAADVLWFANRLLPDSSEKEGRLGRDCSTRISESFVTRLGQRAADKYNQRRKPA